MPPSPCDPASAVQFGGAGKLFRALAITITLAGSIFPALAQTPLRVAAAADLEPVLPPILDQFQKETGIHAEATFQASAALTTQIQNGAPFDLFLSADLSYPKKPKSFQPQKPLPPPPSPPRSRTAHPSTYSSPPTSAIPRS